MKFTPEFFDSGVFLFTRILFAEETEHIVTAALLPHSVTIHFTFSFYFFPYT